MEAVTADTATISAADREFASRLGAVMLSCMTADGGAAMRAIDESGLSFSQMKVLAHLTAAGEDSTVKPIAEALGLSLPSVSRAVDGLVRRKLATRTEDEHDRRQRRVAATAAGRRLAESIIAARLEGLGRFAASLSNEERESLDAALGLLLEREEIAAHYRRYRGAGGRAR